MRSKRWCADRSTRKSSYARWHSAQCSLEPDGRWVAYVSNETGRDEIYVQAFPGLGGKRQISTDGGTEPLWSATG